MFGEFADCTNSPNISLLYELWSAGRAQGPPLRYNQGFRTCFAFCNAPGFSESGAQLPEEEDDEDGAEEAASRSRIICWRVIRIATTVFSCFG